MKYTKETINEKLKPLGWTIPQGIKYKGMLENHAVKCLKCGWIQEKRLDNLIYRHEECSNCGGGVFEATLLDEIEDLKQSLADLKNELQFYLIPKDAEYTFDVKTLYRRYIAKLGIKKFGRKLMSDEWFDISHQLSEELMFEIAPDTTTYQQWEQLYVDILKEHPTKQGQDILPIVVPKSFHSQLVDSISKRMVKL